MKPNESATPAPPSPTPATALDREAIRAIRDFISEITVLISPRRDLTEVGSATILTRFPRSLGFWARTPTTTAAMMSAITFGTGITSRDEKRRLGVEWDKAIAWLDSPRLPHIDNRPGVEMELGDPQCVSGGGLWYLERGETGKIWSPTSHARLIGVPCSFNQGLKTEYAESVALWGNWLREKVEEIDRSVG